MKFLFARRFNYIDGVGITLFANAVREGHWAIGVAVMLTMVVVSIVGEHKAGVI